MAVPATPQDSPPPEKRDYRLGGMGYREGQGRRLDYGSYLHLDGLLQQQAGLTQAHDELLFIVVHQAYELWFKVLLHELEEVRARLDRDDVDRARHFLRRITVIEDLLVEQVEVLETMAPQDFLTFRSELAPASGFQSIQFREIEILSGLRDTSALDHLDASAEDRARLQRRLQARSLWDAFSDLLQRRRAPDLVSLYRERDQYADLVDLSEALLDHDERFALWRDRHVYMVERQIGSKQGTGGSSGVGYLRSTLGKRFYPELWEVRSHL
ncbi:MAG TPA: tryptophan 2,3-dioxygenase family protein [Candidatus Limnocylindrales bacterium]|nr:tryptophan 2,3-dioxygenase family protein [Candidatus Limnocylindrales bacterium]